MVGPPSTKLIPKSQKGHSLPSEKLKPNIFKGRLLCFPYLFFLVPRAVLTGDRPFTCLGNVLFVLNLVSEML